MTDAEEEERTTTRGNEWEVVSLTASAYAAFPGPKELEVNDKTKTNSSAENKAGPSHPLLMSGHFVFPPSQHENLPVDPDVLEIKKENKDDAVASEFHIEEGGRSGRKNEEYLKTNELDAFSGISFIDEKGNKLATHGTEFEACTTLEDIDLVDKEMTEYSSAKFSSLQSETCIGGSTIYGESMFMPGQGEPLDQGLVEDISQLPIPSEDAKYCGSDLPCEAWWKRRAASLYAHAKEANAFWSVFVAAAVMGLIILGQRWQHERWQVLQLKWQFSVNDEMGRAVGPLSRLKNAIVGGGGHCCGTSLRGSASE